MPDLTLGLLHPTGAAAVQRAADVLGVTLPLSIEFIGAPGEFIVGRYTLRRTAAGVSITTPEGEGGTFNADDLAQAIGWFVSERL